MLNEISSKFSNIFTEKRIIVFRLRIRQKQDKN